MDEQRLQVLRTIDKFDKIGVDGVVALLQKPTSEFGAGLTEWQAQLIGRFLCVTGDSSERTIANAKKWFTDAKRVRDRINLMCLLEETVHFDGSTSWDRLLSMTANPDNTWSDSGRPTNLGWALDDILQVLAGER